MNIQQSNAKFIHTMDTKHTQHALNKKQSAAGFNWRDRLRMQFGFDVWRLPVCERCEGYALWHKDENNIPVGSCQCGHITKNPLTVQEYYEQGHHVDRSVHRDAEYIVDREKTKQVQIVYGGEAGLKDTHKKIILPGGKEHVCI